MEMSQPCGWLLQSSFVRGPSGPSQSTDIYPIITVSWLHYNTLQPQKNIKKYPSLYIYSILYIQRDTEIYECISLYIHIPYILTNKRNMYITLSRVVPLGFWRSRHCLRSKNDIKGRIQGISKPELSCWKMGFSWFLPSKLWKKWGLPWFNHQTCEA